MNETRNKPTVFVSSTCYDLRHERESLRNFFIDTYGFNTMLSEFNSFPIDPAIGTFENCLNNVDNYADIFILIIGNRYGFITDKGKSITNLEYLHAKAKGIPVFVFIDKQLHATWNIWKRNKTADYSSVVDTPKIFDFISSIYDELHQWVYPYDSISDITITMKNQLGLIFSDGLIFKKIISTPKYSILNKDLPPEAARTIIEQPFAWEYKFLAYLLKDEFKKLQKDRWNFKYGFFEGHTYFRDPQELIADISNKLQEIRIITEFISVLVNKTMQDALGAPGTPGDLEMLAYVAKQFSSLYERIIAWGLYFKTLYTDPVFDTLLELLYELPTSTLEKLDAFVDNLFKEFTSLPNVEDGVHRSINLQCNLDGGNIDKINEEIIRITNILKN